MTNQQDNSNDDRGANKETIERVKSMANFSVQKLLSVLISQCYSLITHRVDGFTLDAFRKEFDEIILHEPILTLVYDDETEDYWIVETSKVEIQSIEQLPDVHPNLKDTMFCDFPRYEIHPRFLSKVSRGGTANQLWQVVDPAIHNIFAAGWQDLQNSDVQPVEFITPHDLCAYSNFLEFVDRLNWFVLYVLSFDNTPIAMSIPGYLITDRYTMMSVAFFTNLAAGTLSQKIKLPNDMLPFKGYISRAFTNFHERKLESILPPQIKPFIQGMLRGKLTGGIDMSDLRAIPMTERPDIELMLFTSVIARPMTGV